MFRELKKAFCGFLFMQKLRNSDLRFWKTGFHCNGVYFWSLYMTYFLKKLFYSSFSKISFFVANSAKRTNVHNNNSLKLGLSWEPHLIEFVVFHEENTL